VDDLLATKSEDIGLIVRSISFQDFPPYVVMISVFRKDGIGRQYSEYTHE